MKRYKTRLIKDEGTPLTKKTEAQLNDLLKALPLLRKHKMGTDVHAKVRQLRDSRRQRTLTLEMTREFPVYDESYGKMIKRELVATAPLTKQSSKVKTLGKLKADITNQIRMIRSNQRTPIDQYTFREGLTVPKMAEVYLQPGTFVELVRRKVRQNMTKNKVPTSSDKYIGVEIEFASKESREEVIDAFYEADLGKHVCIKGDRSISAGAGELRGYPNAVEITVLTKESEFESIISRVCAVLNEDLSIKVDKSCGLHVHLDMRHGEQDIIPVTVSYANLVNMQHILYAMVPADRKGNRYSNPVSNTAWRVDDSHYDGVSSNAYGKYKTIEVRMHSGTTQALKINNWIKLLLAISKAKALTQIPTSIPQVKELFGISQELADYVESRIATFAKQHMKVNTPNFFADVIQGTASTEVACIEETSEAA